MCKCDCGKTHLFHLNGKKEEKTPGSDGRKRVESCEKVKSVFFTIKTKIAGFKYLMHF